MAAISKRLWDYVYQNMTVQERQAHGLLEMTEVAKVLMDGPYIGVMQSATAYKKLREYEKEMILKYGRPAGQ